MKMKSEKFKFEGCILHLPGTKRLMPSTGDSIIWPGINLSSPSSDSITWPGKNLGPCLPSKIIFPGTKTSSPVFSSRIVLPGIKVLIP